MPLGLKPSETLFISSLARPKIVDLGIHWQTEAGVMACIIDLYRPRPELDEMLVLAFVVIEWQ